MNLRLPRSEDKDIKSFQKYFNVKIDKNMDFARELDNGNQPRCWNYKGYEILRTVEEKEVKSIGRRVNRFEPTYTVYGWKSSGYSYWEPEEHWEEELGDHPTLVKALLAIDAIEKELEYRNFQEGEFWEEMAKEEKKMENYWD